LGVYDDKPKRFLERLFFDEAGNPTKKICCAGFELEAWRCEPFARHLIEWLPEYALPEEELNIHHGNMYVKLQQAAVRVYTSPKYEKRGEAGEIAIHAICRDFFGTLPISPRVFYKTTSNDVIKAFDMVHARFPACGGVELWLGESKLYTDAASAIAEAIESVSMHIEKGFLESQKLFLGPQIPKTTPLYDELMELFAPQTSLDRFLSSAVFVIGILSDSEAAKAAKRIDDSYATRLKGELAKISGKIEGSGLINRIRIVLIYIPLATNGELVAAFDSKLKGLQ
jgi:Cap4 SAVED domain